MQHKPKHTKHTERGPCRRRSVRPRRWLLPVLLVAQLMVILDITAVNIALPNIADGPPDQRLEHQLDDHQLLADLRQPAAPRRPRRRPARPPPACSSPASASSPSRRSPRRWPASAAHALRRPRRPGPRRRDALPGRALDHHQQPSTGRLAPRRSPPGARSAVPAPRSASCVGGVLTQFVDWRLIFFVNLPVAARSPSQP